MSSAKTYRREQLINERREEVLYLSDLLKKSETIEFKPELAREIEQITALAAGLGLSFDPVSGLNYRRAQETGDLQQEISTMRLQLQLDQLKRDAELVRSKFEAQTDPVNADLDKLQDGAVGAASSSAQASAADQLKAAIDKLNAALTTRLDAEGRQAALANATANPIDVFRDRAAYRDVLKAARNAASLDESHDLRGAALIRLTFPTTVFPDQPRGNAPGVIQMKIKPPTFTPNDEERLYAGWLEYINQNLNQRRADDWAPNRELIRTAVADNFEIIEYRFAKPVAAAAVAVAPPPQAPARRGKGVAAAVPAAAAPPNCPGFAVLATSAPDAACGTLVFAVPNFRGLSPTEGAYSSIEKYLAFFDLNASDATERQNEQRARTLLLTLATQLTPSCSLPAMPAGVPPGPAQDDLVFLEDYLREAKVRATGGTLMESLDRIASAELEERNVALPSQGRLDKVLQRTTRASLFVRTFEETAYAGCSEAQRQAFRDDRPRLFVPTGFKQVLKTGSDRVSIYEVGPREQVQQVSTAARAANSLALALNVAASNPGSGAAASAAASYSRQAMGRAQTLERVPAVVGYASATQGVFGWVVGPRMTLDPKGKVDLEQVLKPIDLTVDLSVPAWWPAFEVETVTAWAPGVAAITSGTLGNDANKAKPIPVTMSPNSSDFDILTTRLAAGGLDDRRQAKITQVRGSVSACKAVTLTVQGRYLWRTSAVLIGGRKIDGGALSVMPDMSGVLVDVPALDAALVEPVGDRVTLSVLTPYGADDEVVPWVAKPAAGCKEEAKPAAPDAPSIAGFEPATFQAPAAITFQVKGANLGGVDRATLNGQAGKATAAKDGKSMEVSFTAEQTAGLPVSRSVKFVFFKGADKVDEKLVEVTANSGAN